MSFKFEKLEVWKKALQLSSEISCLVKNFPKEELYVLTSQIKRAADSVSLNIAEGSTGQSNPEFQRFLGFAIRSAVEVAGCLYIASERKLINSAQFKKYYSLSEEIVKMLQALRKAIR